MVGEEETGEAMKADSTSTVTAESSPANTPGSPTAQVGAALDRVVLLTH